MTDASGAGDLRRSKAHLVVADVERPDLQTDQLHHLEAVLRVGDGTLLTVTDGRGSWRSGVYRSGGFESTGAVVFEPRPVRPVAIGVAIPKQDRPEWIVQKLTEIGVATITLLHAERSVVRWDGARASKKLSKLERTAVEALQQSRGLWLPALVGPVDADAVLAESVVAEPGGGPLTAEQSALLVGPEGGWSAREVAAAKGTVGLGPTILRVETAAIFLAVRALGVV